MVEAPNPNPVDIEDSELDIHRFRLHANSAKWTGRGDTSEPHHYTHPDKPDRKFTQEEISALRLAQSKKEAENRAMDGGSDATTPGRNVPDMDTEREGGTERGPRWKSLDKKNYIGVEVKTLEAILKNPEESQYFGDLIKSLEPEMAGLEGKALIGQKLSDDEREMLRYAVYEFSKYLPRALELKKRIQVKDTELAARRNDNLDTEVTLRGKDRITELFKEQAVKLAMRDPERFEDLEQAYKSLDDDRNTRRYQKFEAETHAICKELGIQPKDYDQVIDMRKAKVFLNEGWGVDLTGGPRAETRQDFQKRTREKMGGGGRVVDKMLEKIGKSKGDRLMKRADRLARMSHGASFHSRESIGKKVGVAPENFDQVFDLSKGKIGETRKKLREQVRENMGFFRKATDYALGSLHLSKADMAIVEAQDLNTTRRLFKKSYTIDRVDQSLGIITNMMAHTISGNPELQHMIEQEAFTGKDKVLPEDSGPKTFEDAGKVHAETSTEAVVLKRYDQARKKARNTDGKGWNEWAPDERLAFREKFDPVPKDKMPAGTGFWASVIQAFIRSFWKAPERRNKLPVENI